MEKIRRLILVVGCMAAVGAGSPAFGDPPKAEANPDRWRWVEKCLKDFGKIKVGMTRKQVESRLPVESGLQSFMRSSYVHPECPYFKIDVEYRHQHPTTARSKAIGWGEDKVISISKPYMGYAIED